MPTEIRPQLKTLSPSEALPRAPSPQAAAPVADGRYRALHMLNDAVAVRGQGPFQARCRSTWCRPGGGEPTWSSPRPVFLRGPRPPSGGQQCLSMGPWRVHRDLGADARGRGRGRPRRGGVAPCVRPLRPTLLPKGAAQCEGRNLCVPTLDARCCPFRRCSLRSCLTTSRAQAASHSTTIASCAALSPSRAIPTSVRC